MPFDRAAILRNTHAETRRRMLPTREFCYSLKWCRERRIYVQPLSYAQVLAQELKTAWLNARPLPVLDRPRSPEAEKAAALRYLATIEPFNARGAAAFRALHAQAAAIDASASRQAA